MHVIKKYKNRRLYDTQKSQYITIDELKQYVLENIEFKVEQSESGEDITSLVLLSILLEAQSPQTSHFLSPASLRQLIVLSEHPLHNEYQKAFEGFLSQFEPFMKANSGLEAWQKIFQQWTK